MHFQEHHFKNLGRARDHLSETILSLQSAVDRMTGDDWIDATALLNEITEDIGPRLARLRTAASERFDELTRAEDFEAMRTGRKPFPDERPLLEQYLAPPEPRLVRRAAAGVPEREDRRRTGRQARRDRRGDDGLPARQRRVRPHPGLPVRQHRQAAARLDSSYGLGSFISCGVSGAIGVRFCARAGSLVTMSGE